MPVKKAIFFLLLAVVAYFLSWLGDDPKEYATQLRKGYTGVVIEKYYRKADHIKVRTDGGIIDLATMSLALSKSVHVGDSIKKPPRRNECVLLHDGKAVTMSYMFIPASSRNDSRWPNDLLSIQASN